MKMHLFSLVMLAAVAHSQDSSFVSLALRLRQNELLRVSPPLISPAPAPRPLFGSRYPWHEKITSTVFWCGEPATTTSPSNRKSAFDSRWWLHAPGENPFYFALPYSDIDSGHTRPEASSMGVFD
jgi:hypothetical protein